MRSRRCLGLGIVMVLLFYFGFQWIHSGVAFGKKDSACRYEIPLDQAAAILGVAAGDLNRRSFKRPVSPEDQKNKTYKISPCGYGYRSKSNFLKSISYTVYNYSRPQKARSVFDTMKGNFKTVAKVEAVQGLGDEAFWVNDPRFHRLVALKGTLMIDVVSPKELKLQKRIIRLLLGK